MTYEQVNNRTLLESLAKRQQELTESNVKILDWAMKTVSSKKKERKKLNLEEEISSEPCKAPVQNKTPSATGKKELTLVEEVEECLRMEVANEKASKRKKNEHCLFFFPSL